MEGGEPGGLGRGSPEGEESLREDVFPGLGIVAEKGAEDGAQVAMHAFHLTVPLGIVASGVGNSDAQEFSNVLKEVALKLLSCIRVDGLREAKS